MSVSEDFKQIQDFPNYMIFKDGIVMNCETGHILSPKIDHGYFRVSLCHNHLKLVHRLLAQAFIPNPENHPVVDHIDRDKSNNRLENLRWCTQSDNCFNKDYRKNNNKLGHKHIHQYLRNSNTYYQFTLNRLDKRICKQFKTLEEAIAFRDSILQ